MIRASITSPLAALSLSGFRAGHVHSVFSSSFNVELEGELVHVGRSDALLSCTGLAVPSDAMAALLDGLAAGGVAVARGGALRLYKRSGTEVVDAAGAPVADCSVPRISLGDAAWALGRIKALAPWDHIGIALDQTAREHLAALSSPGGGRPGVEKAVDYLVGRGAGLTPSGDDILMGYAAACMMLGFDSGAEGLVARSLSLSTTDVSASYYRALARGWANPVYRRLALAASSRDAHGFDRCACAIAGIGHTSGMDSLLGMALAFHCPHDRFGSQGLDVLCA